MNLDEFKGKLETIPAIWQALDERYLLNRYAQMVDGGTIMDIGTAFGGTAAIFLMSTEKSRVFSIDTFEGEVCRDFQITKERCWDILKRTLNLSQIIRLSVIEDEAHGVARRWCSQSIRDISLMFIDGDHEYEVVKQDVEDWLPLIKQGGFLLLHDSNRDPNQEESGIIGGYPGPTKVAQELLDDKRVQFIERCYSITVFKVVDRDLGKWDYLFAKAPIESMILV